MSLLEDVAAVKKVTLYLFKILKILYLGASLCLNVCFPVKK